jgi:hypothetical protein
LQATFLSIPVVVGAVGVKLNLIPPPNYAALVAAGLLPVVIFPLTALPLLSRAGPPAHPPGAAGGQGRVAMSAARNHLLPLDAVKQLEAGTVGRVSEGSGPVRDISQGIDRTLVEEGPQVRRPGTAGDRRTRGHTGTGRSFDD